jgi:3-phenylpropionate/trans-cinnamate dioxygenase alpha subunit
MWSFALVDRDAPPEVKRVLRDTALRTFGPSGSFEQDDGGNWADVTRMSRSARRHQVTCNLTMGLGHEAAAPSGHGEIGLTASDLNQRGFYRRWRDEVTR